MEGDFELALSKRLAFGTLTGRAGYLVRRSTGGDDEVAVTLFDITKPVSLGETDRSVTYRGATMAFDLGSQASLTLDGQGIISEDFDNLDAFEGSVRAALRF